ncbi:MAG: T9SS type A sorting domain-containing protein [Lewinella sp.]
MTLFKSLPLLLAFFLLPLFTSDLAAGVFLIRDVLWTPSDSTAIAKSQQLKLSRTYLNGRMLSASYEGREALQRIRKSSGREGTVSGNKSNTSVTITYDDFANHLALGRDRQAQELTAPTGIPMDVGGEDVEGLFWQMPNLPLFGTVLSGTITSSDVATSPYLDDFPGATPTHVFDGGGRYDYYELIADTPTETGALYYYGAADADYIHLGDFVHAPIPLALGLGVFGGEFDPVPCSILDEGCETGNPDEAFYQVFQEFEEVASGTLQTYDDGSTEALKVRNTVTVVFTDINDNVIEESVTNNLIWYSKDGHYLICELAEGAPWTNNTSFVNIKYQKLSVGALPVEWQAVTAEVKKDREVEVRWSTATETANDHFIVERSTDGSNFLRLGVVPAVGNSAGPEEYQFSDEAAQEGFNYYRIKQVDLDGSSSYSSVVSALVALPADGEALTVLYPNPGRNEVFFSRPASYELFNASGQRLASGMAEGSLDVSNFPAGQYLVRLDGGKLHRWVKQ